MMAQYRKIKDQHPDSLLFYRMGDFYELFFDDAVAASEALDIVLAKRGKRLGRDIPMCGVPAHSADGYLQTLIRKGFRVAVCEQTEDPAAARRRGSKSVVAREVVRVLTPGTLTEDELLDARSHNFLAAVAWVRGEAAVAWSDISVGSFRVTPFLAGELPVQLARIAPNEVLHSETAETEVRDMVSDCGATAMPLAPVHFDSTTAERRLCELFDVRTLAAFGDFSRPELGALGAIVSYLDVTQKGRRPMLRPPVRERAEETMQIDAATRRNLEITRDFAGNRDNSLLGSVDRTLTAAGARLLELRICAPSTRSDEIRSRQQAVAHFRERSGLRRDVRGQLRRLPDLNRSLSRLSLRRGGPRDLGALRNGLARAKAVRALLDTGCETSAEESRSGHRLIGKSENEDALQSSRAKLSGFDEILAALEAAVADEPPAFLRDGGLVRGGYCEELDEERTLRDQGRRHITGMQPEFAAETGIAPLKIKHNNVLGYFIEVPPAHSAKLLAPPHAQKFIHRQTVASAVRFTTEDLASAESRLLNAAGRALEIENRIFCELTDLVVQAAAVVSETAAGLAEIDVASALAELSDELDWRQPRIDQSGVLDIRGGRHPVVEQSLLSAAGHPFVANDCLLAGLDESPRIRLVTGPNMAGKSTYLRQNALIVLLAQAGSFVPAESAHIGLVSQLFSRVGASDELAKGRSTFMVEMVETAAILNQAGPDALVILDEIGRGTATYDGLSIAWATLEHLHEVNRCRALFATHYHELTQLTGRLPRLTNSTVTVREWENEIVFLYEVRDGAAERSYGVQVAKLAGMPEAAVGRAREILECLESDEQDAAGKTASLLDELPLFAAARQSQQIHSTPAAKALQEKLCGLNPDDLSPRDALGLIYELKAMAGDS